MHGDPTPALAAAAAASAHPTVASAVASAGVATASEHSSPAATTDTAIAVQPAAKPSKHHPAQEQRCATHVRTRVLLPLC